MRRAATSGGYGVAVEGEGTGFGGVVGLRRRLGGVVAGLRWGSSCRGKSWIGWRRSPWRPDRPPLAGWGGCVLLNFKPSLTNLGTHLARARLDERRVRESPRASGSGRARFGARTLHRPRSIATSGSPIGRILGKPGYSLMTTSHNACGNRRCRGFGRCGARAALGLAKGALAGWAAVKGCDNGSRLVGRRGCGD